MVKLHVGVHTLSFFVVYFTVLIRVGMAFSGSTMVHRWVAGE